MTNQNTMKELANPWVVDLPVYEPGRPLEIVARELGLGSPDGIDKLASNENALGPSPRAVAAMKAAATGMHRYPEGSAYFLREALARHLEVRGDNIVLGNGSNEIIELLAHVFLHPGANVVVADRAFVVYRLVATAFESTITAVPMRDLTHDLDAMREAIRPETKLVFVSNPNNPTGTAVEPAGLYRFIDHLPPHVVAVIDEAYVELMPAELRPDTLAFVRDTRNIFVLRTFSKAYGLAGLRLGYAVASSDGANLLHRVRQPFNANGMAQAAAMAALEDDEHVEQTRRMVQDGLVYLGEECTRLGLPYVPSVANFMLVKVGRGRQAFESLLKEKVIVRPMDVYDLPEYIRVTVGTRSENERLIKALEAVLNQNEHT